MRLKKQNKVTSKMIRFMVNHFQNTGSRIQKSVSHATTPEMWNITIVAGKVISAMVATA
jgi:hypothetical protein